MVRGGVSDFTADIDRRAIDHDKRGSVHQTVDEGRVVIEINLLDLARGLVGRLGPVVILHGDHENGFDV